MSVRTRGQDYLVLSRRQWDKAASREEIRTAIVEFYAWIENAIQEGRMRSGSRLCIERATVSKRVPADGRLPCLRLQQDDRDAGDRCRIFPLYPEHPVYFAGHIDLC